MESIWTIEPDDPWFAPYELVGRQPNDELEDMFFRLKISGSSLVDHVPPNLEVKINERDVQTCRHSQFIVCNAGIISSGGSALVVSTSPDSVSDDILDLSVPRLIIIDCATKLPEFQEFPSSALDVFECGALFGIPTSNWFAKYRIHSVRRTDNFVFFDCALPEFEGGYGIYDREFPPMEIALSAYNEFSHYYWGHTRVWDGNAFELGIPLQKAVAREGYRESFR